MASYNYYLKDGKGKTKTPLYILFDDGVNRCKIYIQESIQPKDWNGEKQEARKTLKGFSDYNQKLKKVKIKCEELHTTLTKEGRFTTDELKIELKNYLDELNNREKTNTTGANKTFKNLTDFAQYFLDTVNTTVKGKVKTKGTKIQNQQTLRILKGYETTKHKRITFDRVNLDFYHDFVEYLTNTKKLSPNTIGRHIKTLKLFLNEATERGYNTKLDYKSKRFVALSEPVEKIYLSEEELEKIYEYDFSNNKRLEQTRDLFIVGCYTGLRFSDFSQLNTGNINNDNVRIKTKKTGEIVVIPLHWTVKQILEKYSDTVKGLPRPISNQKMNDYLKEIGEKVGINERITVSSVKGGLKTSKTVAKFDLITTHTARRSFATNLYKGKFPAISIMKITGHKTERAFLSYIRVTADENAEALREHWNNRVKLKAV